jgi:ubiquinone biosynthesis protein COQ4
MMIRFNQLRKAIQYKNSENLGDFAILKADALGAKVDPAVASQLRSVVGYHPPIDLEQLRQLPEGTFGRTYADHMQANQLKSFNVSPELEDVAQRNVFALRYAVTHDIFHVLLGFDTSYAGEIGVLAFAAEQEYSKSLRLSLQLARVLYPMLAPQQRQAIAANLEQGRELGRKAKFLLGYRFEDHWAQPIDAVKAELGLLSKPQEVCR